MNTIELTGWIIRRAIIVLAAAFLLAGVVAAAHVVTFDHYSGTYGVSIGTNSDYCSIETAWPVLTCESAS